MIVPRSLAERVQLERAEEQAARELASDAGLVLVGSSEWKARRRCGCGRRMNAQSRARGTCWRCEHAGKNRTARLAR